LMVPVKAMVCAAVTVPSVPTPARTTLLLELEAQSSEPLAE
jgi:hypothetical protein